MLPENDQNRESSTPDSEATKPEGAAPAVPPAVTPIEPPETPKDEALTEAEAKGWNDYHMTEIRAMQKADRDDRNDPSLRLEMCRLINDLGDLINDHAHALANEEGDIGAFNLDIKKDLLTWQLAEFLSRSMIDRDPIEPPIVRGWQVDQPHAFDFFRVDEYGDGSLAALEVEGSRSS